MRRPFDAAGNRDTAWTAYRTRRAPPQATNKSSRAAPTETVAGLPASGFMLVAMEVRVLLCMTAPSARKSGSTGSKD